MQMNIYYFEGEYKGPKSKNFITGAPNKMPHCAGFSYDMRYIHIYIFLIYHVYIPVYFLIVYIIYESCIVCV